MTYGRRSLKDIHTNYKNMIFLIREIRKDIHNVHSDILETLRQQVNEEELEELVE